MKFKFSNILKPVRKVRKLHKITTRAVNKVTFIDKRLFKEMLKSIVLGQIAKTGSAIGFVFDDDSIVTSGGQLVGAQSTELPIKGFTVVFYVECLFKQFEIDQNNDLSPTHDNIEKMNIFIKKIVADQIFAIESKPLKN